eukprot:Unigene8164_Nuclearia_a/m.25045 Unigene8164_Nuclearia_a/g.25045  ORF Unigene8164_Nuclearia_a/g.25045 Unigene8164_Nuclearia_a/m.25045 type:complete len:380 (+) Unigene8164_Nuclearia_a:60-1199(+)
MSNDGQAAGPAPPAIAAATDPLREYKAAARRIPLLMDDVPADAGDNPALAAIQSLLYDDTPDAVADNFRQQGNEAYKGALAAGRDPRRLRDAVQSYTKGLAARPPDAALRAALLLNRAAANLELENYRQVKIDCADALAIEPGSAKAHFRLARAHAALGQHNAALEACDVGLRHQSHNDALRAERERILQLIARRQEDERARQAAADLRAQEQRRLDDAIAAAGVRLVTQTATSLAVPEASLGEHKVHLDASGRLHWPMMLLYPEHQQTDIIGDFAQDDTFADHLAVVFEYAADTDEGRALAPPPWDAQRQYKPASLEVFFEVKRADGSPALSRVGQQATLGRVLAHPQYVVVDRVPAFIVLCTATPFYRVFLDRYKAK